MIEPSEVNSSPRKPASRLRPSDAARLAVDCGARSGTAPPRCGGPTPGRRTVPHDRPWHASVGGPRGGHGGDPDAGPRPADRLTGVGRGRRGPGRSLPGEGAHGEHLDRLRLAAPRWSRSWPWSPSSPPSTGGRVGGAASSAIGVPVALGRGGGDRRGAVAGDRGRRRAAVVAAGLGRRSAVLAVVVAVLGWRGAGRGRRAWSVVGVVLTLVVALGSVNARTGTFPTVGRLVTASPEHLVGPARDPRPPGRRWPGPAGCRRRGWCSRSPSRPTVSHFATRPAYVYLPPGLVRPAHTRGCPPWSSCPASRGAPRTGPQDGDADTTADAFAAAHHGGWPRSSSCPTPNGLQHRRLGVRQLRLRKCRDLSGDRCAGLRPLPAGRLDGSRVAGRRRAVGRRDVLGDAGPASPRRLPDLRQLQRVRRRPSTRRRTGPTPSDILFGGSEAAFDAHDPAQLLAGGRFDGIGRLVRGGARTTRRRGPPPTYCSRPPCGPGSPPACRWCPAATTSTCGAGPCRRLPVALVAPRPDRRAGPRAGDVRVAVSRRRPRRTPVREGSAMIAVGLRPARRVQPGPGVGAPPADQRLGRTTPVEGPGGHRPGPRRASPLAARHGVDGGDVRLHRAGPLLRRAGHGAAHPGDRAHLHPGPARPVAPRPHRHPHLGCGRPCCAPACSASWSWPDPQEGHGSPDGRRLGRRPGHPGPARRGGRGAVPLGLTGPAGGAARRRGRHGLGHRRRLREGGHRGAGPRTGGAGMFLHWAVYAVVVERRGRHRACSRRPSPPDRCPPRSRPCSSWTRWPASPWGSSSSASSCGRRRGPSPSRWRSCW